MPGKKQKLRDIILTDEKKEESKDELKEEITEDIIFDKPISNDFLSDFNNINFKSDNDKKEEIKPEIKPVEIKPKTAGKARIMLNDLFNGKSNNTVVKKTKQIKDDDDNDGLFSEKGTEILGREKRELLSKIQQYKSLFPEVFKKFTIKKNATTEELKEYLDEMDVLVSTDSVEQFLTDSIMQSLKMIEGASSYTKYDISGLTDLLKANKQFNTLMKQLYIKYKVFSQVPIEYQAILLVSTTAYICLMKNKKKAELNEFLNQPIYLPPQPQTDIIPPPQETQPEENMPIENIEIIEPLPKPKLKRHNNK